MPVLLPTTMIQLLQASKNDWGDTDDEYGPVGNPVSAAISSPTGSPSVASDGSTVGYTFNLTADVCNLTADMRIKDLTTGVIYDVAWAQTQTGFIPSTVAQLTLVSRSS